MIKVLSFSSCLMILLSLGCDTTSDTYGTHYVTLSSLNGWCLPACQTEFTITPLETYYKESDKDGNLRTLYSERTIEQDWKKIEFYLESVDYRNIETEPTCARCYDGNDYILEIKEGRFRKTIYYTHSKPVAPIESFDSDLRKMQEAFIDHHQQNNLSQ